MKPILTTNMFKDAEKVHQQAYDNVFAETQDAHEAHEYASLSYEKFVNEQYNKMKENYRNLTCIQIGRGIKKARKEKGMPQYELAELVGCAQATISRYEHGDLEPPFTHMVKLSLELFDSMDNMVEYLVLESSEPREK